MQLAPMAAIDANKFVAYVQERRKKRILYKGEYLVICTGVSYKCFDFFLLDNERKTKFFFNN